ncbi:hypothetical protein MM236_03360 [Belliella sp. DSM 107340]|uniref:Transcription elongation factor n=1 Tax=Belliella calami TaxID=2923436 RepID=A0ABS9UK60_9BACT|nr:hypothetical protein [Belliella calami]MCH7397006.1 hypothetical protein [Belliella calami]
MINSTDQIKPALLARSQEILRDQIKDIQEQLKNLQQSSEIEEKSSAGDKYETHQEVLNQNRDLLQKRLSSTKMMLNQINAVPVKPIATVEEGSLLEVPMGKVWVSVPMGKVNLDGVDYLLVSKESPLISALWGLKEGEEGEFRGSKVKIEKIS